MKKNNMYVIVFCCQFLMPTSLLGADISNFDIDDLRLGMATEEVKKLYPETRLGKNNYISLVRRKKSFEAHYSFESKGNKLTSIFKSLRFGYGEKPKVEAFYKSILKKYGKPTAESKNKEILCWGNCISKGSGALQIIYVDKTKAGVNLYVNLERNVYFKLKKIEPIKPRMKEKEKEKVNMDDLL
jgi:hypothetical protein